jgi:hypothetical protein
MVSIQKCGHDDDSTLPSVCAADRDNKNILNTDGREN